jgi:hypothetical protein
VKKLGEFLRPNDDKPSVTLEGKLEFHSVGNVRLKKTIVKVF